MQTGGAFDLPLAGDADMHVEKPARWEGDGGSEDCTARVQRFDPEEWISTLELRPLEGMHLRPISLPLSWISSEG